MTVSTGATVRSAIIGAIQSIARTDLGFEDFEGNVKDYLLEFEWDEQASAYLAARVGGKKEVRAIAVDVEESEEIGAMNNTMRRTYTATVKYYYAPGQKGAGAKLVVDHARKVRAAIYALGSNLSGLCDRFLGVDDLQRVVTRVAESEDGLIVEGAQRFRWDKLAPDY